MSLSLSLSLSLLDTGIVIRSVEEEERADRVSEISDCLLVVVRVRRGDRMVR